MPRRPAIRLVAFAAAGLLASIAVAWLSAILAAPGPKLRTIATMYRDNERPQAGGLDVTWEVDHQICFGGERFHSGITAFPNTSDSVSPRKLLPYWAAAAIPTPEQWHTAGHIASVDGRGWPCICLHASYTTSSTSPRPHVTGGFFLGWYAPAPVPASPFIANPSPRMLPHTPVWPGLVANTLFFAALFALSAALFAVSRRAHRRSRGLCIVCGYPQPDTAFCPECGGAPPNKALKLTGRHVGSPRATSLRNGLRSPSPGKPGMPSSALCCAGTPSRGSPSRASTHVEPPNSHAVAYADVTGHPGARSLA